MLLQGQHGDSPVLLQDLEQVTGDHGAEGPSSRTDSVPYQAGSLTISIKGLSSIFKKEAV